MLPTLYRHLYRPSALHLQLPSPLGALAALLMTTRPRPFAVEVKGDPYGTMSTIKHRLRPVYQVVFREVQRHLCAKAVASAYVTRNAMQRLYPPAPSRFTTNFSNAVLPEQAFASEPRRYQGGAERPVELVTVGMFKSLVKAPDVLLEAMAEALAMPGPPLRADAGG